MNDDAVVDLDLVNRVLDRVGLDPAAAIVDQSNAKAQLLAVEGSRGCRREEIIRPQMLVCYRLSQLRCSCFHP